MWRISLWRIFLRLLGPDHRDTNCTKLLKTLHTETLKAVLKALVWNDIVLNALFGIKKRRCTAPLKNIFCLCACQFCHSLPYYSKSINIKKSRQAEAEHSARCCGVFGIFFQDDRPIIYRVYKHVIDAIYRLHKQYALAAVFGIHSANMPCNNVVW